ncbi:MAG: alanine--tRNA ligase [bacterium]
MKTAEIRTAFLEYFAQRGHRVVSSAPLVPRDDATLLFVNAGMVPFKDVFTGAARREVSRATSSQRCLRVSGKHNDLEEVGRTPRHHTFFEMLGNFSFGDYFKEEAIGFAWELLVDVFKLDPKRLAFTVFGGADGIAGDDEAAAIWRRVAGVGDDRVLRFGMKDNFWAMGDTGPCGPCSEIHYDLGADLAGTVNDGDRWMEIWNLVFMQYERDATGKLRPLPAPSIDTGMGLERISSVAQGKRTNYDGDLFAGLLARIASVAGRPYDGSASDDAVSMRVIADHARATAFLLADGVHPDRTGRGYVLRKIMRRAVSHGVLLGIHREFLADVCEGVADAMGDAYPSLRERLAEVRRGAEGEERSFRRTVEEGMRRIDDLLAQLEDDSVWRVAPDGRRVLAGDVAFRLYDTYGCPLELTASVGVRKGFSVDEAAFGEALEIQKERSRASWKGSTGKGALDRFTADAKLAHATKFTGYADLEGSSKVVALALVAEDGLASSARAGEGASVAVVTESTPFYGEGGGQVGDAGELVAAGARVRVEDTRKTGGDVFVHFGTIEEGELAVGESVTQRVDAARRTLVCGHHSATHLVHHALREILGKHVQQKGSWVGPDRLRFDFSHPEPVRPAQLADIETRVNELVRADHDVTAESLAYADAIAAGALAFFGDKYGDRVRMVTMGPSRELCGGTHVGATGKLGLFTLASEGSVAAGIRRIEAFAGSPAIEGVHALRERLERIAELLKVAPEAVPARVEELAEEAKRLRRKVEELTRAAAGNAASEIASRAVDVDGHRLVVARAPVDSRDALRDLGDAMRATPRTVVVLGALLEGKVALVAAVSDDVAKAGRVSAGDLVGRVARLMGGGGGGKPHLATAGAKEVGKLDEALQAVPKIVTELLKP